jgi:transposase
MTGKVIIVYVGGFFMGIIRTKYAIESKLQAIELHLKGLGKFTIAKELNIGRSIIIRWVQHYEREGLAGLEEKRGKATSTRKRRSKNNPLSLEEKLVRLQAENEYLKKLLMLRKEERKSKTATVNTLQSSH